jgi:hypothetical protein
VVRQLPRLPRDLRCALGPVSGLADFAWIDIEDESDALGDPDIENSRPCFSLTPAACASSAP